MCKLFALLSSSYTKFSLERVFLEGFGSNSNSWKTFSRV